MKQCLTCEHFIQSQNRCGKPSYINCELQSAEIMDNVAHGCVGCQYSKGGTRCSLAASEYCATRAALEGSKAPASDPVNHPSHYTYGGIETIDFIEAKKLPYHLGNVVKYVSRAGKKEDRLEDLKKAQWYLNRYIELMENNDAESK